jgi:hypothetical protein
MLISAQQHLLAYGSAINLSVSLIILFGKAILGNQPHCGLAAKMYDDQAR